MMSGLAELAAVMMIGAERRIDTTSVNVSNINTPGYRSRRIFAELVDPATALPVSQEVVARSVRSAPFVETGGALDFATDAGSLLALRSAEGFTFTRSGQFQRMSDGRLLDGQGRALVGSDGSDLMVSTSTPEILPDGVVLAGGEPQGKIGLFDADKSAPGSEEPAEFASGGVVWQGRLTASDVELGDEMLELNRSSRIAETGAKLFQIRDDLLAKAASQMGSMGR